MKTKELLFSKSNQYSEKKKLYSIYKIQSKDQFA